MRAQQSFLFDLPERTKANPPLPRNSTAMEVEKFLDEVSNDMAKQAEDKAKKTAPGEDDDRRARTDRDRDRYNGDRRDGRRSGRDRDRSRDRDTYIPRESNGERRQSRERRRRDGSRPRSSKSKDADTDEERSRYGRRSNSRDRYRGSRRDRGDRAAGDFYSGGGRGARSRSPRRDREDRREDRYRDRSRDRARRDRDVEERRGVAAPGGRRRTPTPEPTEDDRDKRTIFVQQISQRAETRHLRSFFESVGAVVEAQIVKDRVTGRSKGYV